MKVYNTLTREKEDFVPIHKNRVNMFVCGPTVYDMPHIGHARTYVAFDAIARYLRYKGYQVFYLMNITDIDDKMIQRANERGIAVKELARQYTDAFMQDMEALGVTSVNLYANATDYIDEIIWQVKTLIEKGYAYESNGSVYFEVNKFKGFGKLSRQKMDELKAGARVELDENKRNPEDFALWKAHKEGEPWWESPWGKGRPGWHVEDTAITFTYFGEQYDLHGGAQDLIFPHHESEIAIAESISGKEPFVKYWLHTGFLNLKGEKMSKSLGNVLTIREMTKRYLADTLRFYFLYTHYRSPIDFSFDDLEETHRALTGMKRNAQDLREIAKSAEPDMSEAVKFRERFIEVMDDDFNTREAIANLFSLFNEANKHRDNPALVAGYLKVAGEIANVLGIRLFTVQSGGKEKEILQILLDLREQARENKDWATSDYIRDRLKEIRIIIEDTREGQKVRWE